ncbi:MutS-related protein [Tenacibaculum maritimum]|uniref:MutS-related protein n=1 Tax=Tenacibaculum maritimum TaxID=107401 RepID=UPI0012E501C1|nr:DNA mismatch repair protein MutS [Tenacibaculum maritimum]CAA0187095.1 Probable transmembrane hypothetical protein [Tenacibaculum maritimum]CAA0206974.1 Probable transmembrane hypothetical protein [Tenacibaculum maritimum]
MKNNLLQFYTNEKATFEQKLLTIKKQLLNISIFRFSVFLATAFGIYTTFGIFPDVLLVSFIGIGIFTILIVKHTNLQRQKKLINAKIKINETEIAILQGNYHTLDTGDKFINPNHSYSNDIDLFGEGSFFQYTNRTATKEGQAAFAKLLTANNIQSIPNKQEAIKELANKIRWRQHFHALASLTTHKNNTEDMVKWIHNYTNVFPSFLAFLPIFFSSISFVLIGLLSFQIVSFSLFLLWFFIGLTVTGIYVKKIQGLYTETDKVRETFKQYHQLLNEIENENFISKILQEKQVVIQSENKKASLIFKEFAKILDAFDQRNNLLIALIGNALFLWDLNSSCKTEKWITKYRHTVEKWFEVVAFFDAQNSLANFAYNHPNYTFPEISHVKSVIKTTQLGHPLLNTEKRIDNNFIIDKEQFFIITGANMAGKSTFLRTISLAIIMANCGLPVCSKEFTYRPIKLITSMRTSDSLTDDASYFYSELKRLKFIVNQIKTEDYFIILDEILKGTNSKDKAIGSKKFVEKLSASKSTGIIATHDISLCDLADAFSEIENYYFDAEIVNDELHFDYTFKKGICKNMNASFLLKKMEII